VYDGTHAIAPAEKIGGRWSPEDSATAKLTPARNIVVTLVVWPLAGIRWRRRLGCFFEPERASVRTALVLSL
jgi:hypothetical protein